MVKMQLDLNDVTTAISMIARLPCLVWSLVCEQRRNPGLNGGRVSMVAMGRNNACAGIHIYRPAIERSSGGRHVQVKVKVTLEQTTKAQSGSRCIAYSFFNFGASWVGWSTPRLGRFTPGIDPVPIE